MPINARIEDFDEDGLKELFEAALDKVNITDTDPTSVAVPWFILKGPEILIFFSPSPFSPFP